jgi:hypothetical protein
MEKIEEIEPFPVAAHANAHDHQKNYHHTVVGFQ